MDHFGPGIEFLDINADGGHVNFTCFSEKTVSEDGGYFRSWRCFTVGFSRLMGWTSCSKETSADINRRGDG